VLLCRVQCRAYVTVWSRHLPGRCCRSIPACCASSSCPAPTARRRQSRPCYAVHCSGWSPASRVGSMSLSVTPAVGCVTMSTCQLASSMSRRCGNATMDAECLVNGSPLPPTDSLGVRKFLCFQFCCPSVPKETSVCEICIGPLKNMVHFCLLSKFCRNKAV